MFQFPGLPPHWLCVHQWVIGHYSNGVFLFGDPCVFVCLRLNTAFRSLPRPSSALSAKASTACPYLLNLLLSCAYSSYFRSYHYLLGKIFLRLCQKNSSLIFFPFLKFDKLLLCNFQRTFHILRCDGDKEIRTPDPLLARQVLSQLSYTPILTTYNLKWWAEVDSNHRPHAYQACALTS